MTPEIQSKIAIWRARASGQGEPLSIEEMREAVVLLRAGRVAAASTAAKSRAKAKAAIPSGDDLLDEAMR